MPHEFITPAGQVAYRTKLMELARAAAFARCLQSNSSRFRSVEIVPSTRAPSGYFVAFQPASPLRRDSMLQTQQDARAARAETQDFIFWRSDTFWWCFSVESGETYEVGTHGSGCSCPDYLYRCRSSGIRCKHMIALDVQRRSGQLDTVGNAPPPEIAAAFDCFAAAYMAQPR